MKDILANAKTLQGLAPTTQVDNTLATGPVIDRAGYGAVEFVIYAGTLTTAGATFTPAIDAGDLANMSDATGVTTKELGLLGKIADATFTGNDDNKTFRLGYAGPRRYLRLNIQPASNAAAATFGAVAILSDAAFGSGTQASMP